MNIPKDFNFNEFSYTNTSLLKLYDTLSVINYSLRLIEQEGRHEFESVIMQQLRMLFTKGNNIYHDYKKSDLTEEENSFSLFDILGEYQFTYKDGCVEKVSETKMFPEIKIEYRDYEDRINSDSKYFHYTDKSIVQSNRFTVEEFLKQPYVKVTDAAGEDKYKTVEQSIKIIANKLQGAHYQVHIKKVELDVIQRSNVVAQTLGMVAIKILLPMVQDILLQDDKMINSNSYSQYMEKKEFVSFSIYSATPIFDENTED